MASNTPVDVLTCARIPLQAQRFVAKLVQLVPRLGTCHLGALRDAVLSSGIDLDRWSAPGALAAIDADTISRGWTTPNEFTNPAGWVKMRLTAIAHVLAGPTPAEVAIQDREANRRAAELRAAEAAEARPAAASTRAAARAAFAASQREKADRRRAARCA